MAVAVVLTFPGGTLERYDKALAKLGFVPGGRGPAHGLFSWAEATDEGLVVTGVWDSRRAFEQFAERFGSMAASIGIPGPPKVSIREVHSYQTAG